MKLIDFGIFVVLEVRNRPGINSGDLTEAVWGSSGRGNSSLTKSLFPHLERKGLIKIEKKGRAFVFNLGPNAEAFINLPENAKHVNEFGKG